MSNAIVKPFFLLDIFYHFETDYIFQKLCIFPFSPAGRTFFPQKPRIPMKKIEPATADSIIFQYTDPIYRHGLFHRP
ncbi:MAG TPA: hypothetical protein IAA08_06800, partial [Candidatus Eubacterium avistercoris]|nr:hypothetical protein [Candidatus Eubacterium avistercoris]